MARDSVAPWGSLAGGASVAPRDAAAPRQNEHRDRSCLRPRWLPLFVPVYASRKYNSCPAPRHAPRRSISVALASCQQRVDTVFRHDAAGGRAARLPRQAVGLSGVSASRCPPFQAAVAAQRPAAASRRVRHPCRAAWEKGGGRGIHAAASGGGLGCLVPVSRVPRFRVSRRGLPATPRLGILPRESPPQKCGTAVHACTLPPRNHPATGDLPGDSPLTQPGPIAITAYGIAGFGPGRVRPMQHDPGHRFWY